MLGVRHFLLQHLVFKLLPHCMSALARKNEKENRMRIEGLFLFLLEEEQLPLTPLSYTGVPGGHT